MDFPYDSHSTAPATMELAFDDGNGLPPGSVRVGDIYYETGIAAPAEFLGERSEYLGGVLEYDIFLRWSDNAVYPAVVLNAGDFSLYYNSASPPIGEWYRFEVPLLPCGWRLNARTGPVATEDDMRRALANLKGLYIATEWQTGPDDTSVDNIILHPGPPISPDLVRCPGEGASFSIGAPDGEGITYLWRRNGAPLDAALNPSAATHELVLSVLDGEDAGRYDCVVGSGCGVRTSAAAVLDVYCECGGFEDQGGVMDDFAAPPPAEPASPSAGFAATILPRLPLNFDRVPGVDGVATDRPVMHTFTGLPRLIERAHLELRVRAGDNNGGEINDALRIGFTADGVFHQQWARFLGSGAEEPGLFGVRWASGVTRDIQLDLAALPLADGGTLDLRMLFAERGYIDVYVGDDTGVDFVRLVGEGSDGRVEAWIGAQPEDVVACGERDVEFRVIAGGIGGGFTYQWRRDSFPLVDGDRVSGASTPTLRIVEAGANDGGLYDCLVIGANTCMPEGVVSEPGQLRVCSGDFNCDGSIGSQDFFDFLSAFFGGSIGADVNRDGNVNSQDFFDFLARFLSGC